LTGLPLWHGREALRDLHHPSKLVSLTALNIVLNIVYSRLGGV
jgi:hypothetical protein